MEKIYWNKIRILVSNKCNYKCPFCHNEGQTKDFTNEVMSFSDFKLFVDMLKGQSLSEINISGGEPFLNKEVTEMLQYLCNEFTCDISCATNLSLITDEDIDKLAKTRVKFNIQFPYASSELFKKSTGNGNLTHILHKIEKVRNKGINIGLNTVVQSSEKSLYERVIMFALENELPLKLLPQIGNNNESMHYKNIIYPILEQFSIEFRDKMSGATRWTLSYNGKKTVVLYIDSPCFTKNIERCRNYGEIRIHPNFFAQTCINKSTGLFLKIHDDRTTVIIQLSELWKSFTNC